MKDELKKQLDPYFNDIKDFIKLTARGTENALRTEVKQIETALQKEMQEGFERSHNAIKSVKVEVNEFRSDVNVLKADVSELKIDVKEIRVEMKDMEVRLSDKIDSLHTRLDEHETKPINLAHPQQ